MLQSNSFYYMRVDLFSTTQSKAVLPTLVLSFLMVLNYRTKDGI